MELDLDLRGRRVLVVGSARAARHALARSGRAGATVFLASPPSSSASLTPALAPLEGVRVVALPRHRATWRRMLSGLDLVVLVELDEAGEAVLRDVSRGTRTWIVREDAAAVSAVGTVTLVGAGPGDEGLMTVSGRRALQNADLVLFDRLAPHRQLSEWAPGAELIDVGKTPGHHAVPQSKIEQLMVDGALAGRTVVRLKGGDPFVFGRGGEEVAACRAAGVTVTVISGVTSAIAVPGAAGVPVTHRDTSRMFTVVSGHAPLDDELLTHLVGLGGTIVVLMGVNTLPQLSAGLRRRGMDKGMPLAIIERGLTPDQRTTVTTIGDATLIAGKLGVRSPAVLVIGEVVRLHHDEDAAVTELLNDSVASATGR